MAFQIAGITPPDEVVKKIDERSGMAAVGDLGAYTQFQAAQAMRDAAQNEGAAGGAAGQLGTTVDSTSNATLGANGAAGGLIQISNDITAGASSTLTVATKNAKLESGTQFLLQTTSVVTVNRSKRKQ